MAQKMKPLKDGRYCLYCGTELERKKYNENYEDYTHFQKRKFCNIECCSKYELLKYRPDSTWRTAHQTAQNINKKIKRIHYCEECHALNVKIDMHHKNENWRDNSLNNLQALCRSCHIKKHHIDSVCIICGDKMKGYGYCNKHYIRYKKYGCPLYYGFNKECKICEMTKEKMEKCIAAEKSGTELESSRPLSASGSKD